MFRSMFGKRPQTFYDHLEKYMRANKRITSSRTQRHYTVTFHQLAEFLGQNPKLSDLTDANLTAFMAHLTAVGRSAPTVNSRRNCLCAFWRWCHRQGLIDTQPTVKTIPEPTREALRWSEDELAKIFRVCKAQTEPVCNVDGAGWWYSLNLFWFSTGERIGAAMSARWDDLDNGLLLIRKTSSKGFKTPRLHELSCDVLEAIEAIRHPTRELIWPWPGGDFWFHYRMRIIVASGVKYEKWRTTPQRMRRSYLATLEDVR